MVGRLLSTDVCYPMMRKSGISTLLTSEKRIRTGFISAT